MVLDDRSAAPREYEITVRGVADEDEAREIARTLNADRRHLTVEQRRPVVAALREEGHSVRAIAGALGVNRGSVEKDLRGVTVVTPDRIEGQDGKSYPATKPKAEPRPETNGRRGYRKAKDTPFRVRGDFLRHPRLHRSWSMEHREGRRNVEGEYLSPAQAARRLDLSKGAVLRLSDLGRLPVTMTPIGRLYRIEDVDRLAEQRAQQAVR